MLPITRKISAYNHSDGNTKEYIVEHDTGCLTTDTDEENAQYFGSADRQASANYFVDDDSITQVVEDYEASWNCGDGAMMYGIGNHNSISIEMCRVNGVVTAKTEQNALELTQYLMAKYNIPVTKVVRHYDASRKSCPSSFMPNNWDRWFKFKAKLVASPVVAPTVAKVDTNVLSVQKSLNRLKFVGANGLALTEDGVAGSNTTFAIKKFQSVCALTVDGVAGNLTIVALNTILTKPLCGITYKIPTLIRYIQYRLGILVDGVFGNGTKASVMQFQKTNNLVADGVVGNATWTKLIG